MLDVKKCLKLKNVAVFAGGMTTASNIQANAEDVLAEAKEINRARAEEAFGEEEEAAEDFTETTEKAEDAE